jgi:hypothetical protein
MYKTCRICGEEKRLSEFHRANTMRDGFRNECKDCFRVLWKARYDADPERRRRAVERAKAWQRANPERLREAQRRIRARPGYAERMRARHLIRKYGITLEDYDVMLVAQGGGCAICGGPEPEGQSLHVDHDHTTGAVRGLLCFTCNAGIGMFGHDVTVLDAAAAYLRR